METPACEACGSGRATVSVTAASGTATLCKACFASRHGPRAGTMAVDLPRFYALLSGGDDDTPPAASAAAGCPQCGLELSELMRCGMAGCPTCYEVFGDAVLASLERQRLGP